MSLLFEIQKLKGVRMKRGRQMSEDKLDKSENRRLRRIRMIAQNMINWQRKRGKT